MSEAAVATAAGSLNAQVMRLAALQFLQRRAARAGSADELGFVAVNETLQVVPYHQAALWNARRGVTAVSGAERPEPGAPYVRWLGTLFAELRRHPAAGDAVAVDRASLGRRGVDAAWDEWLAPHALWCPFRTPDGRVAGGLLLARQDPWTDGDRDVAAHLGVAYTQAFLVSTLRGRIRVGARFTRRRALVALAAVLVVCAAALPVRESVLAPAEIVPEAPSYVRAPFAGVVASIAVAPNAVVHKGDLVATMDSRQLRTQADVATKALEVARAEYQEATQQAMTDAKARADVAPLASKIDEASADLDYQRRLLERTRVLAPADGIAVYADPSEWVGKPVEIGERIMLVSPPTSRRLAVHVPVAAAVTFAVGSRVVFFDDVRPDHPLRGRVIFASYGATPGRDGSLAYEFRADLAPATQDGPGLRLGTQGTGKILGERRPLALWVLRKPIMVVRQWLSV